MRLIFLLLVSINCTIINFDIIWLISQFLETYDAVHLAMMSKETLLAFLPRLPDEYSVWFKYSLNDLLYKDLPNKIEFSFFYPLFDQSRSIDSQWYLKGLSLFDTEAYCHLIRDKKIKKMDVERTFLLLLRLREFDKFHSVVQSIEIDEKEKGSWITSAIAKDLVKFYPEYAVEIIPTVFNECIIESFLESCVEFFNEDIMQALFGRTLTQLVVHEVTRYACRKKNIEFVKFVFNQDLCKHSIHSKPLFASQLIPRVVAGQSIEILHFLCDKARSSSRNPLRFFKPLASSFKLASKLGNTEILYFLISKYPKVWLSVREHCGKTALQFDNLDIVKIIYSDDFVLSVKNIHFNAVHFSSMQVLEYLYDLYETNSDYSYIGSEEAHIHLITVNLSRNEMSPIFLLLNRKAKNPSKYLNFDPGMRNNRILRRVCRRGDVETLRQLNDLALKYPFLFSTIDLTMWRNIQREQVLLYGHQDMIDYLNDICSNFQAFSNLQ